VEAGAGVGFGVFIMALIPAVLIAKTLTVKVTARRFGGYGYALKLYYLAFYPVSF
jgi:solute carrier family 6 GABA transporter-like protein 1